MGDLLRGSGRHSLSDRLGLANSAMALVTLIIAGVIAYLALSRQLDEQGMEELRSKAQAFAHILSEVSEPLSGAAGQHQLRSALFGHEDLHLLVMDARDGRPHFASSALAEASAGPTRSAVPGPDPVLWSFRPAYPVASIVVSGSTARRDQVRAVLSLDRSRDHRLLAEFIWGSAFSFSIFWVVLLVGSWWIARIELAPLVRFSDMAVRIRAGSLSHRLETHDLPGDLAVLGAEFNAMLARIEEGMRRMANFSADLAHELRTPIGILYGRTQVALSRTRSKEELRRVLEDNVLELERLSRLVTDMLFIAQDEDASAVAAMTPLDLRGVAEGIIEFLSVVADERGVRLSVSGDASVVAHELLIQRAVMNLLSNAIRHADPNSEVRIALSRSPHGAVIEVINQGAPIPDEHLGRIFQRFYRMDESRTRDAGGSGLGLAIVETIARLHGGTVSAECRSGRETRFRLELPEGGADSRPA